MPIDVTKFKALLGDRILVKPLAAPEKKGGLYLPANRAAKTQQTDIWWGTVESLGRDAKFPDAYGITVGDIIGIHSMGRQCETLVGTDGEEHVWVPEEFIAAKDLGRVAAFHSGGKSPLVGIQPVGSYVMVRPESEQEATTGGIVIPMNAREAQKMGEVLAASDGDICGSDLVALHVEAGQRIVFGRYSGSWVKLDEELLLMKQEDIVAVTEAAREVARA